MKRVIKHPKKMKNAMYIVFGVFALALFAITRIHPSYASEGLMIDDALDAIVLYGEVEQLPEDEEVEVQDEQIQEVEEDEDIVESEETTNEEIKEENKTSEDLDETILERDNKKIDKIENKVDIMTDKKATLLTGSEFNKKIKNLVPGANATNRYTPDNTIKNIKMAANVISIPLNAVLISGADSDFPIYAWYDDGDIFYYFTGTDKIYLNQDSMGIFGYFKKVETIDLSKFDTSMVKDMYGMFHTDEELQSIDLSNFNTENLEGMQYFMKGCKKIKNVNLSGFVTNKVVFMHDLFENCTSLETVNLDNWSLGGGNNLSNLGQGIFANNPNLRYVSAKNWKNIPDNISFGIEQFFGSYAISGTLDITNRDTLNVTDMSYSLYSMPYVTEIIGLETWNVDNVTTMNSMFKGSGIKSINVSGWNTENLKDTYAMFEGCEDLEEIIGVNTRDTSKITSMGCMFYKCKNLKYINLDNRDLSSLNKMSDGGSSMFYQAYSLTGISARNWKAPEDLYSWISSWTIYNTPVESIDVSNWDMSNVKKTNFMFTDITTPVKIIGLETWDTSGVINMRGMFTRSTGITGLDLSNWDTSNVEDMYMMFQGASNLETVYVGKNFNTDKVTNSENMFSGAISLVGGRGTIFDENHIDKEYAKIDALGDSGYFTQGEFDIEYNLDGGELENRKTSYRIRESFTIQEPIKEEAVFLGWTGSNGNILQKEINIQKGTTGDLEFTANWKANQYKIIFDTDGGNEINSIDVDYNSLLTGINLPIPTKECNDFSRWDVELPERMPAHDITLKAIWEYTCSRSSGGGGGAKKSESTTREIAIDTSTDQEHNSADEGQKTEINETSNTPINGETSNQVISVTQEISEDGTPIEVVVQTVTIKNTDIVATVRTEILSSNTTHSSSSSKTHTKEENDAYSFAKSNGITTTDSIDNAKMNTELTRIQMAKMLSNYAVNVLGQEPDVSKGTIKFDDVTNKMDKQYDNAVTKAYQLGIMGQNMKNNEFRPNDEVTRAEFASALSRLLYQTEEGNYKGTGKYYIPHIARLYNEGIINKTDPKIKEKRGYVMTMLMRTVQ